MHYFCPLYITGRNYYLPTANSKKELLPIYNTQQRRIITCLSTTNNREELLPGYNKEELLPVYNTQQRRNTNCLQQTTNANYYLSTTNNK
jgi:hypothetical protein